MNDHYNREMWPHADDEPDTQSESPRVFYLPSVSAAVDTLAAVLSLLRRDFRLAVELRGKPFAALEITWGQKARQR